MPGSSSTVPATLAVITVVACLPASNSRAELLGNLCGSWEGGEEWCGGGERAEGAFYRRAGRQQAGACGGHGQCLGAREGVGQWTTFC
jgi:hypothetical protein